MAHPTLFPGGWGALLEAAPEAALFRVPAVREKRPPQARVVGRERRQPVAEVGARPPGAVRVAGRGELVLEVGGADESWRGVGERVRRQEAECCGVVGVQRPDEV